MTTAEVAIGRTSGLAYVHGWSVGLCKNRVCYGVAYTVQDERNVFNERLQCPLAA